MFVAKKYFSGLTRDTFLLTFTSLFADISTEMLYPVIPIFLTTYLGAGGAIVGIVEGIATATQYVQMGVAGWLSDKFKKRKALAIAGYSMAAISKPLIGLSTAWTGVLGARFLDRFGSGTRSSPRDALVAGSADEAHRGKAFGLEGIGDNLGAFLGPILAIVLLYYFKIEIRSIFYLSIIPGLLAVVMVLFVRERPDGFKSKSTLEVKLKNFPKDYWKYLGITAVFGLGNISSSFMILQSKNVGVPLITTILIYAFYNLAATLVSFPSGTLSDRFGRRNVLLFSFVLFFVSLVGFSRVLSYSSLVISFLLYGAYQGIFRAAGKAFASDFVPQGLRASSIGLYNTVVGLSGLFASLLAGLLYDRIGHSTVFATAAIFVFLGSFLLLIFRESR